jgi:predicted membrane channel-forming protein YqfA (hemolysin III family)
MLACSLSTLGMLFTKKPSNNTSILQIVLSVGIFTLLYCSMTPIAFSFLSARRTTSYSAIILVLWKSSLAAYEVFIFEGKIRIVVVPALKEP